MWRSDRRDARDATHGGTTAPSRLRCEVADQGSYGLVRVSGVLDPAGAESLRDALLTRLADRAGPVVVDVTELRVTDPAARAVFGAVRDEVADWPAADLLLYDRDADAAARWTGAGFPAWQSLADALRAGTTAAALDLQLAPVVGAARQARELVTEGCGRWRVPELAEAGCLAVTEMVNNVVAHAHTPMTVRVAPRGAALHLAVRDHAPHRPTYAGTVVPPTSTGGRGLLLIDTVARRWGDTPVPDGKVVWAVVEDEV